ncbi:MAG TPA: 2-C-methyl-D-erythritol 4-phosphate cytidylyltransferase [Candidatus Obscuribacterales bacterium]
MKQPDTIPVIAAVLVAGGSGQRFGRSEVAKQYLPLGQCPIYIWSLRKFLLHDRISHVVLVVTSSMVDKVASEVRQQLPASGEKLSVTAGGDSRQQSVFAGLEFLAGKRSDIDIVLVHDAARPFVTTSMIDDVIKGTAETGACTVGLPLADTVKKVDSGIIIDTVDRRELYTVQTPQGADFNKLMSAHRQAQKDNWDTTDDAAMMEKLGVKVRIVPGSAWNIKITTPDDLRICEALVPAILKNLEPR